jgi:hypothetical protein
VVLRVTLTINEIGGESNPPNFEYARIVEAETARQKVKLHQRIAIRD